MNEILRNNTDEQIEKLTPKLLDGRYLVLQVLFYITTSIITATTTPATTTTLSVSSSVSLLTTAKKRMYFLKLFASTTPEAVLLCNVHTHR